MAENNGGEKFIVVKSWQTLLTLLALLGSIVVSYTTIKAQTQENERRIQHLEEQTVNKDQLDDIKSRLERIERKLDQVEERRHP
jgi:hypothetical protein